MSKFFALLLVLLLVFVPSPSIHESRINRPVTKSPVPLGPVDSAQVLALSLALRGQAPGDLQGLLALINTPSSPQYHHYLASGEIARRFGVSSQNKRRLNAVLLAAGLPAPTYSKDVLLAGFHITAGQA